MTAAGGPADLPGTPGIPGNPGGPVGPGAPTVDAVQLIGLDVELSRHTPGWPGGPATGRPGLPGTPCIHYQPPVHRPSDRSAETYAGCARRSTASKS